MLPIVVFWRILLLTSVLGQVVHHGCEGYLRSPAALSPSPSPSSRWRFNLPAVDASSASSSFEFIRQAQGTWYSMGDCYVLLPPNDPVPKSIIHFVGGFLAGSQPQLTYSGMLSSLAEAGHLIVATPIPELDLNHGNVAAGISSSFTDCYNNHVRPLLGKSGVDVPVIGLSHSLGGKLTLLVNSRKADRKTLPARTHNVFLAFNNYGMQQNFKTMAAQAKTASPQAQKFFESLESPQVQRTLNAIKESKLAEDLYSTLFKKSLSSPSASSTANEHGEDGDDDDDSKTSAARRSRSTPTSFEKLGDRYRDSDNPIDASVSQLGRKLGGLMESLGAQLGVDIARRVDEFSRDVKNQLEASLASSDFDVPQSVKDINLDLTSIEFTPNAEETWDLVKSGYNVQRNIIIKFNKDEIDQGDALRENLKVRGCDVWMETLEGNHLTPNLVTLVSLGPAAKSSRKEDAAAAAADDDDDDDDDDDFDVFEEGKKKMSRDEGGTSSRAALDGTADAEAFMRKLLSVMDALVEDGGGSFASEWGLPLKSSASN